MTTAIRMRRREMHAAVAKTSTSAAGVTQMLMPYRTGNAVVLQNFKFKPGFVYTQVRAISARINQNFDGWPSGQLKQSYHTFVGKPIFVNHQNKDYKRARGQVVAARYVEAGDDKYVDTIMEVDAQRFPKIAQEIIDGSMDSVSMGVECGFTICSYCHNKAVDVPDFCDHVRFHKGQTLPRYNEKTGATEDVLVYESCHKLGFFELSYVFDPADETAVVSRVISASVHPSSVRDVEAAIHRLAYGEIEAPEDVDTLRSEDEDQEDQFKHYVDSPKELKGPNLDQTQRLDRIQEQEGLDGGRRVEDLHGLEGSPLASETQQEQDPNQFLSPGGNHMARTSRRRYAGDEDPAAAAAPGGGAPAGPPQQPQQSDEDLIQEAEQDLEQAQSAAGGGGDEFGGGDDGGDFGGGDDLEDDSDPSADLGDGDGDDAGGFPDGDADDSGLGADADGGAPDFGGGDEGGAPHDDSDLPPWLANGDTSAAEDHTPPIAEHQARRAGNRPTSSQKKGKAMKGAPMGLAQRSRTAAAQSPRRHYADDSGHTDGGPYGENDQGEQEDVFLSQTPGGEAVSAPVPGDGTISNSENNLVASKLQKRIQAQNAALKRDIIAYEQITGRRVTADDGEWPNPGAQSVSGTETADSVDPELSGTDEQGLRGDFDDIALDSSQTQPKDASVRAFAAFDQWLKKTTGKTAKQHNNWAFIRRSAARYCSQNSLVPDSLFPTLGNVLREARKNESKSNVRKGGKMQRRADESLDVAAPQDRIDVEAPTNDTTDADAQASQFPLGDFGGNASDNLADPDLSPDSQIWAPGEGDGSKTSNRKTDGITAVRYAEAYIQAGLAPNTSDEKWKIAGLAQTMRHGTIVDRIKLLDAVNKVASTRRTAGVNRGATSPVPPGIGQRQLTAGTAHEAANDTSSDMALWLK